MAALLDGRLKLSAIYWAVAGVFALFGIIHSPLASAPIDLPQNIVPQLDETARFQTPYLWAAAYGLTALFVLCLDFLPHRKAAEAGAGQH